MRICLISDTHERHRELELPDADLLLHAGDATMNGKLSAIADFDDWLASLPHRHKVVIAGNHDRTFETHPEKARPLIRHATYLQDSGVTIDGVRIWGSPWQPEFMSWSFNLERGAPLREKWGLIPNDTDVLMTHGPPLGHGDWVARDERVGCEQLALRLLDLDVRLHVFGHIHEGYGITTTGKTMFANASTCDLGYEATQPPMLLEWRGRGELPLVLEGGQWISSFGSELGRERGGGQRQAPCASCLHGNPSDRRLKPTSENPE